LTNQKENIKDLVSIIIPCRNEEKYIGKVLDNVIAQDYPKDFQEVFVVDGESEDKTRDIIQDYTAKYKNINYLSNPERVVPFALNKAIKMARGSIILRMDAHAVYPKNYVSELVKGIYDYNCENTGGAWITEPANKSLQAMAIAESTSHPFGIGNAYYRLSIKKPKKVDTVPFGCYKREVFDQIGLFDEDLVRNQDDEFNARLIKNGGSIFLLPHIKIKYYCRGTFGKIANMFYQYGLYKPLVNLKIGVPATLRQFAPPLFTLIIILSAIAGFYYPPFFRAFATVFGIYLMSSILVSISIVTRRSKPFILLFYLFLAFPIIHFSYGLGYLAGILRFTILRRPIHHSKSG
jgi:glycosyltransferase involved in cell wall biosynthesis